MNSRAPDPYALANSQLADFFNKIGAKLPFAGMSARGGRTDMPRLRAEVAF
jgi:hypothetical protein